MTTDTDHALTFALAGRMYFDGDRSLAVVEINMAAAAIRGTANLACLPQPGRFVVALLGAMALSDTFV